MQTFGKKLERTKGIKDLNVAKHFRNHILIEWKTLKEQYSPDTEERRIQNAIAGLHKQTTLRAPLQTVPTLTAINTLTDTVISAHSRRWLNLLAP